MLSNVGILRIKNLIIESQSVENEIFESLKAEILKVESLNAWTLKDHEKHHCVGNRHTR